MKGRGNSDVRLNGATQHQPMQRPPAGRHGGGSTTLPAKALTSDASALMRDRLIEDLNALVDADQAARWAKRSIPEKNKLTAVDARRVEDAFQAKLENLVPPMTRDARLPTGRKEDVKTERTFRRRPRRSTRASSLCPEPRRVRDREHVKSCGSAPLLDLRSPPLGCPSRAVRSNWSARAKSERRVHCAFVPGASSRGAPLRQRGAVVGQRWD